MEWMRMVLMNEAGGGDAGGGGGDMGGGGSVEGGSVGGGGGGGGEVGEASVEGGGEPTAEGGGEAKGAAARYRYRRGGEDAEATGNELAAMLGDDHEHEFTWGKDDRQKSWRGKWDDVRRAVQQQDGAMGKMQQYQEALAKHEKSLTYGKANPLEFFAGQLGLHQYESANAGPNGQRSRGVKAWVMDQARDFYTQDAQVAELLQSDPTQAASLMREQSDKQFRMEQAMRQQEQLQQQQQATRQEANQKRKGEIQEAFREVGVPWNSVSEHLLQQEFKKLISAGMDPRDITPQDLAAYTRTALHQHALGVVDSHGDDALLQLLGDGRRKKLRELELKAVEQGKKVARKEQRQAQQQQAAGTSGSGAGGAQRTPTTGYKKGIGLSLA